MDNKESVNEFLSKVYGEPMTLKQFMAMIVIKSFRRSWSEQEQPVRQRRRELVMAMALEVAEIRKSTRQATGLCELAIENVITGDFSSLRSWAHEFNFEGDDLEYQERYRPLFVKFKKLCLEAADFLEHIENNGFSISKEEVVS